MSFEKSLLELWEVCPLRVRQFQMTISSLIKPVDPNYQLFCTCSQDGSALLLTPLRDSVGGSWVWIRPSDNYFSGWLNPKLLFLFLCICVCICAHAEGTRECWLKKGKEKLKAVNRILPRKTNPKSWRLKKWPQASLAVLWLQLSCE